MKRILALCLVSALLLSGCSSWLDGSYHNKTPHQAQGSQITPGAVSVADFDGLCNALITLVKSGIESNVIYVSRYEQAVIERDMQRAVEQVCRTDPIAAYAVDTINWEMGSSGAQSAVAVSIKYIHNRTEIMKIRTVKDLNDARVVIGAELADFSTGVVLYVKNYESVDFAQLVEDHAAEHPQTIMETPNVTVNVYPDSGDSRVVELKFAYQTSRDALRNMQNQVNPVFRSAALYVSGDAGALEKFSQLYSFLMERYDYDIQTSITPSYSLLRHGVGDARAFSIVYGAMCRSAGLDCRTISGTRRGESWYWNLICVDGVYYHVDLLASNASGGLRLRVDREMQGYVWDYSAYPESVVPETTAPATTAPETTVPESTAPETTVPTTTAPETSVPESVTPETTEPATTVPDTTAAATEE